MCSSPFFPTYPDTHLLCSDGLNTFGFMNTKSLSSIDFPQDLINIPSGQIFILTNPNLGITSKDIFMMQFIFSMARQYDKKHIVKERTVDAPWLWGHCACLIKGEKVDKLLIADKGSLVEMLCELWGLDYESVCKSIVIPSRNKDITCDGDSHPVRVQLVHSKNLNSLISVGDNHFTLNCIVESSREKTMGDLRGIFQEMFSHSINVSLDDITDLYNKVKNTRKQYKLDIQVKRGVDALGNPEKKVESCKIALVDNAGVSYPLKMETMWISLYLTYILFKEGRKVCDIGDPDFMNTFHKIHHQLPSGYKTFKPDGLVENAKYNLSKIRKAILDATNDIYAKEQFAIDGHSGDIYKVAGATDDDRALIKEAFGLE